jgi:DNA-binding transcriptional LysR family regulator
MVPLRVLQYFVATAQQNGISGAARQLHISPASVSVAVADLENTLNIQLFVRQPTHGMRLTPAGEIILAEARSLLAHADEFQSRAGALGYSLEGNLSVACFTNLGPVYFSNLLAKFCHIYPSVSVNIYVGDQQEILSGLTGGQYELAVTFDLDLPKTFKWLRLATIPPQIVLPRRHKFARLSKLSLKRMASEPLILMDLPHTRDYFTSLFHGLRIEPNIRFRSTNFEMVRTLVGNDLGYSILNLVPRHWSTYDGTNVKYVPISEDVRPLEVGCLSIGRVAERRIAKAFIEFTQKYFASLHV